MSDTSISYLKYLKYKAKYMQLKHELFGGLPGSRNRSRPRSRRQSRGEEEEEEEGKKEVLKRLIWTKIIVPLKQKDTLSDLIKDEAGFMDILNPLKMSVAISTSDTDAGEAANFFIRWLCANFGTGAGAGKVFKINLKKVLAMSEADFNV
jgi:hypothetical protein